ETKAVPSEAPPTAATLRTGTEVRLQLTDSLSSETAKRGSPVKFLVIDDVLVDGHIVVKRGALATGLIGPVTRQLLTRGGALEVAVTSVTAVDGSLVELKGGKIANGGRGPVRGN